MSKGALALLCVAGVGLLFAISYTVGLWPPDTAAPIYRDGVAIASSWSDRLERVATAGILIGGVIALGVASWRAHSADQQANAAQKQVDTALRQVDTAQKQVATAQRQAQTAYQGLLNERYQKGAEMLGSSVLSVRFAGIYALGQLAEDHPEQYYIQIMQLLCAFVRYPPDTDVPRVSTEGSARVDVTETVAWIGGHRNRAIEVLSEYQPDLTDAHLQDAYLGGADLSSALLENGMIS